MGKTNSSKILDGEIWDGITDEDFELETGEDTDLIDHDVQRMVAFYANTNLFRQIKRLSDGLKPVERRIMFCMYKLKAVNDNYFKCAKITSDTMGFHPHSDDSIYGTLVGLCQSWRTAVPLIDGIGNYGNKINASGYGQKRYTDAVMSKFAYRCFFDNIYDKDCVEMMWNEAAKENEPVSLPTRFPIILINGAFGIGTAGNFMTIPPYNVFDVIKLITRLLENPNDPNIHILPDFPTGADIVDDGTLENINNIGKGRIIQRSTIDIVNGYFETGKRRIPAWELHILNLPWMVDWEPIQKDLVELVKTKKLPVLDIQNCSKPVKVKGKRDLEMEIDIVVYVAKDHDPYQIRENLWKLTSLSKTFAIDFKVITEDYRIKQANLRELALSWIDERRGYLRRLYNKKLADISADIDFLEVMIEVTDPKYRHDIVKIVRESDTHNLMNRLMEICHIQSYQAKKLGGLRISDLTKDKREIYIKELEKDKKLQSIYTDYIQKEHMVDRIILDDMNELRQFGTPRKTSIITDTGKKILDTTHHILVTKQGYIMKFVYNKGEATPVGQLKRDDFASLHTILRSTEQALFFDSTGRVSSIPVYEIPTTDKSQYGTQARELTKLNGEIIAVLPYYTKNTKNFAKEELNTSAYLITLSEKGYFKKMDLSDYMEIRSFKNNRATQLKENDKLIYAGYIFDSANVIVYTKRGMCCNIAAKNIPIQTKNSQGLLSCEMEEGDQCIGLTRVNGFNYLFVLSEKGYAKKIDLNYMISEGKRRSPMIPIISLEENDSLCAVVGFSKKVRIMTKNQYYDFTKDDIPTLLSLSKGEKMVAIPQGVRILSVEGI